MSISPSVLSFDPSVKAPASVGASTTSAFGALSGLFGTGAGFSSVFAETSTCAGAAVSIHADAVLPPVAPLTPIQVTASLFGSFNPTPSIGMSDTEPPEAASSPTATTSESAVVTTEAEANLAVDLGGRAIIPNLLAQSPLSFSAAVYQSNAVAFGPNGTDGTLAADTTELALISTSATPSTPIDAAVTVDLDAAIDPFLSLALTPGTGLLSSLVCPATVDADVSVDSDADIEIEAHVVANALTTTSPSLPAPAPTGGIESSPATTAGVKNDVLLDLDAENVPGPKVETIATTAVSIPIRFVAAAAPALVNVDATVSLPATVLADATVAVKLESDFVPVDVDAAVDPDATLSVSTPVASDAYSASLALGLGVVNSSAAPVVDISDAISSSSRQATGMNHSAIAPDGDASLSRTLSAVSGGGAPAQDTTATSPSIVGTPVAGAMTPDLKTAASIPMADAWVAQTVLSSNSAPMTASNVGPTVPSDAKSIVSAAAANLQPATTALTAATADLSGKISLDSPLSVEAQTTTAAAAQVANATAATVQEKFAADLAVRRSPRASDRVTGALSNKKDVLNVDAKVVAKQSSAVGTETANPVAPMVHDIRQTRFASLSGEGFVSASGVGRAAAGVAPRAEAEAASSTASAAVQAVRQITDAADVLASTDRSHVNLTLKLDDVGVAVNVEYRNGELRATFHTDSTELRDALSAAWQTQASAVSDQKPYRFAEPVYTSTSTPANGGGSSSSQGFSMGGDTPRHFSHSSQSESAQATFAASSRLRTSGAATAASTATASRPVVAASSTLRLEAFA